MGKPRNLKDVQRLIGCVVVLSRFISWLGKKGLPLYRLLEKFDSFEWTNEDKVAFDDLKHLLYTPPILAALAEREPLLLYITATSRVVSIALLVECTKEGSVQKVQ